MMKHEKSNGDELSSRKKSSKVSCQLFETEKGDLNFRRSEFDANENEVCLLASNNLSLRFNILEQKTTVVGILEELSLFSLMKRNQYNYV
jgi:hypothetical protein